MIRIFGTIFAGLLGLAFGSFLNVCLTRWPQGESIVHPRSHCRSCDHVLAWWENFPLLSWLVLRGRCRNCHTWIGWRYPLVELAVAILWASAAWHSFGMILLPDPPKFDIALVDAIGRMVFYWLLVALAVLDAENLWLPDSITLPGTALGFLSAVFLGPLDDFWRVSGDTATQAAESDLLAILIGAGFMLLIRFVYWLIRGREGLGLGDVKLMAMLAAWLGLLPALLAFGLAVVLGALVALMTLLVPSVRSGKKGWALTKLPLGTFLCFGGLMSWFWGERILDVYLRWAGF
jgi:leader peptidase (prepilin peptidase)/N-methyltransferase